MTPRRNKGLLGAAALAVLATAALAQERPTSILPPGFGEAPPPPPVAPAPAKASGSSTPKGSTGAPPAATDPLSPAPDEPVAAPGTGEDQTSETDSLSAADLAAADIPQAKELPDTARRDPSLVGRLDPAAIGIGADPWRAASGRFLEVAMRRTNGAMPSRWLHIALRNALLAKAPTPYGVDPADWVAERGWLLLRMGEAEASRMLVSGVDVADFTPKLRQVAVQSALANADPAGLCPLRDGLDEVEPRIAALVDAICASLSGNAATAAADIDDARRRGRPGGIDVSLADKLVGAGADTARAVTIEWAPVDRLNSWRFGLASASGIAVPDRLFSASAPQFRAWQARAPMLTVDQRLSAARTATGLGVFSGQSLVDVYSALYDRTDPDDLSQTDAWQLRVAFLGRDQAARLTAMRKLWGDASDASPEHEGARAMLAIAASQVRADAKLGDDAPNLIASLLAGGMDDAVSRWAPVLDGMDQATQDRCWALVALGAASPAGIDLSESRVDGFIKRDDSPGKRRSALLLAGLVGTERIDGQLGFRLSTRYGLGLERHNSWTDLIDGAAARGQGGTATVLAGLAFRADRWSGIPPLFVYHAVKALRKTDQSFNARMIAAEALSRS